MIVVAFCWSFLQACLVYAGTTSHFRGFPIFAKAVVIDENEILSNHAEISVEYSGYSLLILVPSSLCFASGYLWAASKKRREPVG